jgi:hypothetical protein
MVKAGQTVVINSFGEDHWYNPYLKKGMKFKIICPYPNLKDVYIGFNPEFKGGHSSYGVVPKELINEKHYYSYWNLWELDFDIIEDVINEEDLW